MWLQQCGRLQYLLAAAVVINEIYIYIYMNTFSINQIVCGFLIGSVNRCPGIHVAVSVIICLITNGSNGDDQ